MSVVFAKILEKLKFLEFIGLYFVKTFELPAVNLESHRALLASLALPRSERWAR